MEAAPEGWQRACWMHEFIHRFFARAINLDEPKLTNTNQNPLDLDERVFLKNKSPFLDSSPWQTHWTMMMGYTFNVSTQAPYVEDWASLQAGV